MALAAICVRMARGPTFVSMGRPEATELDKRAEMPLCDAPIGLADQVTKFAAAQGSAVPKVVKGYNGQANIYRCRPGSHWGGPSTPVNSRSLTDTGTTKVQLARVARLSSADDTIGLLEGVFRRLRAKTVNVYGEPSRDGVAATSLKHEPILGEEKSHGFAPYGLARPIVAFLSKWIIPMSARWTPPELSWTLTAAVSRASRPGGASGESWVRAGMREAPQAWLSVPATSTADIAATRIVSSPSTPVVMAGPGAARGVHVTRRRVATLGTVLCEMGAALVPHFGVWRL